MTTYMPISAFQVLGYLQEVNRRFLHPLGLALEVHSLPEGSSYLAGVRDYRDDPEGLVFGEGVLSPGKAAFIDAEWARRAPVRERAVGYMVQPLDAESAEVRGDHHDRKERPMSRDEKRAACICDPQHGHGTDSACERTTVATDDALQLPAVDAAVRDLIAAIRTLPGLQRRVATESALWRLLEELEG